MYFVNIITNHNKKVGCKRNQLKQKLKAVFIKFQQPLCLHSRQLAREGGTVHAQINSQGCAVKGYLKGLLPAAALPA